MRAAPRCNQTGRVASIRLACMLPAGLLAGTWLNLPVKPPRLSLSVTVLLQSPRAALPLDRPMLRVANAMSRPPAEGGEAGPSDSGGGAGIRHAKRNAFYFNYIYINVIQIRERWLFLFKL